MRKLIYVAIALVVLAGAALLALPALVSTQTVRDLVAQTVKDNTGRTVAFNGDLAFSVFPTVSVDAKDVTISNPPGFDAKTPFASMKRMNINLGLAAALSGTVAIDGVTLIEPKINLVVDKNGRNNWRFGTPGPQAPAQAPAQADEAGNFGFGTIRITRGDIVMTDAGKGTRDHLADINLKLTTADAAGLLRATGDLVWNDDKVKFDASLNSPARLQAGTAAELKAKLTSRKLNADIAGSLTLKDQTYRLDNGKFALNGLAATGRLSVTTGKARPVIEGDLATGDLNLNDHLKLEKSAKSGENRGWSRENIDFSGLKAADGVVKLAVKSIRYDKITTGPATITARLENGRAIVDIPNLALYDGSAKIALSVDTRRQTPTLKTIGALANINARSLMQDLAGSDKLEGHADAEFNLTSSGGSLHAIMARLAGTARIIVSKGALNGVDIAGTLRAVHRGQTAGLPRKGKTPFGTFRADYQFKSGVGVNRNLKLSGGEVLITGSGRVVMPAQTLAYTVHPSLVGKGGISVLGINVPIIITGPWSNPRVYPDLPGILDTPGMALNGLKTIGEGGVKGVTGVLDAVNPLSKPGQKENPVGKVLKSPFKKLF